LGPGYPELNEGDIDAGLTEFSTSGKIRLEFGTKQTEQDGQSFTHQKKINYVVRDEKWEKGVSD
jgi:hypothetical protein